MTDSAEKHAAEKPAAERPAAEKRDRPQCLWFEPSAPILARLRSVVQAEGHDVIVVSTLPEVLHVLRQRLPDYLVLRLDRQGQVLRLTDAMAGIQKLSSRPVVLYGDSSAGRYEGTIGRARTADSSVIRVPGPMAMRDVFQQRFRRAVFEATGERPHFDPNVSGVVRAVRPMSRDFINEQFKRSDGVAVALRHFSSVVDQVSNGTLPGPIAPEFLVEARRLVADGRTSFQSLADFVSRHQSASARLLSAANGAFYTRSQSVRIDSVQQAVQRLGMKRVARLLEAVAMRAYLVGSDKELRRLINTSLRISLCTALYCEYLASRMGLADEDFLYSAGLFHNIGSTFFLYAAAVLKEQGAFDEIDYEALFATAEKKGPTFNRILASKMSLSKELMGLAQLEDGPIPSGRSREAVLHQSIWLATATLSPSRSFELDDTAHEIGLTTDIVTFASRDAGEILDAVNQLHTPD